MSLPVDLNRERLRRDPRFRIDWELIPTDEGLRVRCPCGGETFYIYDNRGPICAQCKLEVPQ